MVALLRDYADERAGVISFDKEGFYFQDDACQKNFRLKPINDGIRSNEISKGLFLGEMENVVKQTLISNLTHKEILELVDGWDGIETNEILRKLFLLPIDKVIEHLDNILGKTEKII